VTIITVAFFAHWTRSLILKHAVYGVVAWAGTLGNAVHSLLSAEKRVSTIWLMLPLSFKYQLWWYNSFKTKRKSCNNSIKDFVLRSSCRVTPLLTSVPFFFFND